MDKFEEARITIADIDRQIAILFEERMEAIKIIADFKNKHGLQIYDQQREQSLLAQNMEHINNKDYVLYYQQFQQNMMNISKSYQEKLMEEKQ